MVLILIYFVMLCATALNCPFFFIKIIPDIAQSHWCRTTTTEITAYHTTSGQLCTGHLSLGQLSTRNAIPCDHYPYRTITPKVNYVSQIFFYLGFSFYFMSKTRNAWRNFLPLVLSLYSTRTQNHLRWVLLRHLTQKKVLLRYLTQEFFLCIFHSRRVANANPICSGI